MQKYKQLNKKHPSYNIDAWNKRRMLYNGDEVTKNACQFIPKLITETNNAYHARLLEASYINYMSTIIDRYVSELFSPELSIIPINSRISDPFYQEFSANADRKGTKFANVLRSAFTTALIIGTAYIGIDFPKPNQEPVSLADEEAMGLNRAYIYEIMPEQIINFSLDDRDQFRWVVIKRCFFNDESPFHDDESKITQFKIWIKTSRGVEWKIYEATSNQEHNDSDDFPLVDEGLSSFHEIPIIPIKVNQGLCIGNKIANLCADHFRKYSSLSYSMSKNNNAVPYIAQGSEIQDNELNEVQSDSGRHFKAENQWVQRGFMVIGADDKLGFLEPSGSALQQTNTQLKELVDEIYRTTFQMAHSVSNTSSSLGRSGLSKMQDNVSTTIILNYYSTVVKDVSKTIYNTISKLRKDNTSWQALGMDNYDFGDREESIKEAALASTIEIPSSTFRKYYLCKIASQLLPDAPQEILIKIKEEIDQSDEHKTIPAMHLPQDKEENKEIDNG